MTPRAAARELAGALRMVADPGASWRAPVLACSAETGKGLDEVWAAVDRHRATLDAAGELAARRADQQVQWMWSTGRDRLMVRLRNDPAVRAAIPELEAAVREGALTATLAAEAVLGRMGITSPASGGHRVATPASRPTPSPPHGRACGRAHGLEPFSADS